MLNTLVDAIIKWRWLSIVVTLVGVAVLAYGAKYITVASDYRVFFSQENEQLMAFERIQDTYNKSDNIFMVVEPKNGAGVFSTQVLSALQKLTEQAWQIPYAYRIDSITNFQHSRAEDDDLLIEDLVGSFDEIDPARTQHIAINEPALKDRLVSPNGEVTAINVQLQLPQESASEIPSAVAYTRNMLEEFQHKHPNLKVYLTGSVLFGNAFVESSQHDLRNLVPIMFLIIIIVLWFLLRSVAGTMATLAVILLSIISAMGTFGWLQWTISSPVASAPTIILTMAVAHSVHILVTYLYYLRSGRDKEAAMKESLMINISPVFITSVTTILGFLSMNLSEAPPFRDLGNTVAIGVAFACAFSIFFLPALMMVLPCRVDKNKSPQTTWTEPLANFVIHKRKPILVLATGLSILAVVIIPTNKINDEFIKYFSEDVQFRVDTDFTEEHLTGIYNIDVSLVSADEAGVSSPQFLQEVEAFANWARSIPEVVHVNSLSETFKRINKNMNADQESFYRLPEDQLLAAQYLLLYEMSLPYGLGLDNQVDIEKSSLKLTVTLQNIPSAQTLEIEQLFVEWLSNKEHILTFDLASPTLMFSHIGKRNVESMLQGIAYTSILMCLVLALALRSFKLGFLSLFPNLLPIAFAFAVWALFSGNVGLSIGASVGMILGIVVDDTVHFLSKYQWAKTKYKATDAEAVQYAFSVVGTALCVTTFVLVIGFTVLSLSSFNMNVDLGLFTACAMVVALAFDFFVLPAILLTVNKDKQGVPA